MHCVNLYIASFIASSLPWASTNVLSVPGAEQFYPQCEGGRVHEAPWSGHDAPSP